MTDETVTEKRTEVERTEERTPADQPQGGEDQPVEKPEQD